MESLRIEFMVGECDPIDRFLADRIYEFNARATSCADGESFAAVRRDTSGAIVAGVSGYTWGGCCYVSNLWVAELLRANGMGRALLLAVENHAHDRGCKIILVSSHSFQAPLLLRTSGLPSASFDRRPSDRSRKHRPRQAYFLNEVGRIRKSSRRGHRLVPSSNRSKPDLSILSGGWAP
jgi:GNAT superfamily N-acetyltransferase